MSKRSGSPVVQRPVPSRVGPAPAFPLRPALLAALAGLAAWTAPGITLAQPAGAAEQATADATNDQLLRDFVYYVRIARFDVAAGVGQELLAKGLAPVDFTTLVESSPESARFEEAVGRAMRRTEVEPTASQLLRLYQQGRLERARNPDEVARNIEALTGTARARVAARERLVAAGEYAMPQLLAALLDGSNAARQAEVQRVIVALGRQAIIPLATALPGLAPAQQEAVAGVLGNVPYRSSMPFLADLAASTPHQNVRDAAQRSLDRLGGLPTESMAGSDAAGLYRQLAEAYYGEKSEVTSFPGEPNQLLWSFDPGVGLTAQAIATPVFHEAMAMRLSERALRLSDGDSPDALGLWIASNFKREAQEPRGYDNPAYGDDRREPMYYAVAAGPQIAQAVLARGLDTRDTALSRRAIAAVERTAGGDALWGSGIDRRPLVEALTYPNRRVQYDAALALAAARPTTGFPGAERVVPTLASAIRDASSRYAVVVSGNAEAYQATRRTLEGQGFTVLAQARAVGDVADVSVEAPAVDLVVALAPDVERAAGVVDGVRGTPRTAATPVLVLSDASMFPELRRRFEGDAGVAVRQSAINDEQLRRSIDDLLGASSGGLIGAEEAAEYASRSLSALRDLSISTTGAYDVGDASGPLIAALESGAGAARNRVAEVLANIPRSAAQVALMDAALGASGLEQVTLLGEVSRSAKRFGNQLEERQTRRLVELASSDDSAVATAAAALMGSLNLPNRDLTPLILGER